MDEDLRIRERLRGLEVRIDEREKALNERWRAQEAASVQRAAELERKLYLLNDLRSGVLTRTEYDARHENLVKEVSRLRELITVTVGEQRGHASTVTVMIAGSTAFVLILSLVASLLTHGFK